MERQNLKDDKEMSEMVTDVPLTAVWLRSLEVCLLLFTPAPQLIFASKERIGKEPSDDLSLSEQLGLSGSR